MPAEAALRQVPAKTWRSKWRDEAARVREHVLQLVGKRTFSQAVSAFPARRGRRLAAPDCPFAASPCLESTTLRCNAGEQTGMLIAEAE